MAEFEVNCVNYVTKKPSSRYVLLRTLTRGLNHVEPYVANGRMQQPYRYANGNHVSLYYILHFLDHSKFPELLNSNKKIT